MNKLKTFQDFRNEISIIELALSVGYRIRKKDGIKWPVLKDDVSGDKIIIVNAVLYNYQHLPLPEKAILQSRSKDVEEAYKLKEFHFPGGLTELSDPGYLYFRGIKSEIIGSGLFEGKIFNVKGNDFNNLGFPYHNADGKIIGFELRNRDFKSVVEGSDRSVGIWHSNIPVPVKNVV